MPEEVQRQGAAAGEWHEPCDVTRAGPAEDGNIYIWLKGPGNDPFDAWYVANDEVATEMLLVALTAISNGKRVSVYLSDKKPYSIVNRLYLIR